MLKQVLLVVLLVFLIAFPVVTSSMPTVTKTSCQYEAPASVSEPNLKRGCCSWHGGVCGCKNGRAVVCCDGSYSPTCGCD